MAYAASAEPSRRVEIWFDGPARQRRWTVLIRLILVIPQVIVIAFMLLAAYVAVIIGWFAALVMGRLPPWVQRFATGVVRWLARLSAYGYLLTDRYPPFSVEDEAYPVRPVMPAGGELNRAAVLFRVVLAIPAALFQSIVNYGLVIPLLLVTWFIVLFTGDMPPALYGAYAALLRFQTRFNAYIFLLTSEYPWGMLGDRLPAAPPPYPAPTTSGWPPATTSTEAQPPASPESAAPVPPPAARAWPPPPPPNWGSGPPSPPPPPPPNEPPDRSRLVLPKAARGWLIFAIVWGSILYVSQASIQAAFTNTSSTTAAQHDTVANDFNRARAAIEEAIAKFDSCSTVPCLRASHEAAAASLQKFDSDLKSMNLPSNAQEPAQLVESDLTQLAPLFNQLANSPNLQDYRSIVQIGGLTTLLQSLPADTNGLLKALKPGIF